MASERPGLPSFVSIYRRVLNSHLALCLQTAHWIHLTSLILRHHTFGSAGSDGIISIWDHTAKKRLRQYPKYHNSVNDISFNTNGTKLAVGVSYGWEKGEPAAKLAENARVSVFIREIGDEVKVRLPHFNPMRGIELPTLIVKSSSQRQRREPGSFGRVSQFLSFVTILTSTHGLRCHFCADVSYYVKCYFLAAFVYLLCLLAIEPRTWTTISTAGKRLLRTLGRFSVPAKGPCGK